MLDAGLSPDDFPCIHTVTLLKDLKLRLAIDHIFGWEVVFGVSCAMLLLLG